MDSPAIDLFRCDRRDMTLTRAGCGRLYQSANGAKKPDPWEGRSACMGCPTGMYHLTGHKAHPSALLVARLGRVCERCLRPASRLIWGALCPSCDARHREAVRGVTYKGNRPALADLLRPAGIIVSSGNMSRLFVRPAVTNLFEVIIHAAKSYEAGPLTFGRVRLIWPVTPGLPVT